MKYEVKQIDGQWFVTAQAEHSESATVITKPQRSEHAAKFLLNLLELEDKDYEV